MSLKKKIQQIAYLTAREVVAQAFVIRNQQVNNASQAGAEVIEVDGVNVTVKMQNGEVQTLLLGTDKPLSPGRKGFSDGIYFKF